ncbi:3-oxoacyl-reductase [Purpureocillium lavendulum]|uniref:3-oxoacyl-reductase n=1 Tax=Purpureocillium lavendulum TaxID=1247861 RepID=A0AB34FSW2_9HYPO|nr:3-oxoacyl-reductase [Purpureocillium lavendulum]
MEGKAQEQTVSKQEVLRLYDETLGKKAQRGGADSKSPYYYDRIADPAEIASLGVFLSSNLAAAVNGQSIVADSGKIAAAFGESLMGSVAMMTPM